MSPLTQAEPAAVRKRIAELDAELAIHRRAAELLGEVASPKGGFEAVRVMAGEGHSVERACQMLHVADSAATPGATVRSWPARCGTPG